MFITGKGHFNTSVKIQIKLIMVIKVIQDIEIYHNRWMDGWMDGSGDKQSGQVSKYGKSGVSAQFLYCVISLWNVHL